MTTERLWRKGTDDSEGPRCERLAASDARLVIVDDLLAAAAIGPIPGGAATVFRRGLELIVGDVDLVAAELLVVGQERPRHRIVILAETEETAEAHHRIRDLAADLVDHHPLDLADLLAV